MPATAVELLEKVRHELSFTALEWKTFEATFNRATRKLLERSAPGFFSVTNLALQRDIFLALARLLDPPVNQRKQETVSFPSLVAALPRSTERAVRTRLKRRVKALTRRAALMVAFRNHHLAHNDLDHVLGRKKLETSSRVEVRRVLRAAGLLLAEIAEVVTPGTIPTALRNRHIGGSRRLLRLLSKAMRRNRERLVYE